MKIKNDKYNQKIDSENNIFNKHMRKFDNIKIEYKKIQLNNQKFYIEEIENLINLSNSENKSDLQNLQTINETFHHFLDSNQYKILNEYFYFSHMYDVFKPKLDLADKEEFEKRNINMTANFLEINLEELINFNKEINRKYS